MSRFAWIVALFLCVVSSLASADNVTRLQRKLETGNANVRLSAVLNLAKVKDQRAIPLLLSALSDGNKTVRGAAAAGLAKLAAVKGASKYRKSVVRALKNRVKKDRHRFVRQQAGKSLQAWEVNGSPGGGAIVRKGGIYVHVESLSDGTGGNADITNETGAFIKKSLAEVAPVYATQWFPGKKPTGKAIRQQRVRAFMVGGTVNQLSVEDGTAGVVVHCKINVFVATYPKKSMFGFLSGGAQVSSSSGTNAVEDAKKTCVSAVLENLVKKKVVLALEAKAR